MFTSDELFMEFCEKHGLRTDDEQYDFWAWAKRTYGVDLDFPPLSLRDDMLDEFRAHDTAAAPA